MPSPQPWHLSLTTIANSPSLLACILMSRPTPRISRVAGLRVAVIDHQRHLTGVVDEAHALQPLVRDPLVEPHRVEVAEVDAAVRKRLVEPHHQRLVFGPDRPDTSTAHAVLHCPGTDVLRRVGADGRAWAACPGVGRGRAVPRGRPARRAVRPRPGSGLMSISLIQACSATIWLNWTSSCSRRRQVYRRDARASPRSAEKIRVCSIIRRARVVLSGGRASARSR